MPHDIRRLTDESRDLLRRVAEDVFDEPIQPAFLDAFLACPRHVMFLAVANGEVVGMASGVEYFHPDKPPQLWINEVGVAPAHRRRGVGRALTRALIDEAERRGCSYAWLGTAEDNVAGRACFASVPGAEEPQPFWLFGWDLEK